jgi:MFS family permease
MGRFIYGIGCGLLSICAPRFLEETVPDRLLSLYQPILMTSTAVGVLISLLFGAGLPSDEHPELLGQSQFWKVIIGLPIPL